MGKLGIELKCVLLHMYAPSYVSGQAGHLEICGSNGECNLALDLATPDCNPSQRSFGRSAVRQPESHFQQAMDDRTYADLVAQFGLCHAAGVTGAQTASRGQVQASTRAAHGSRTLRLTICLQGRGLSGRSLVQTDGMEPAREDDLSLVQLKRWCARTSATHSFKPPHLMYAVFCHEAQVQVALASMLNKFTSSLHLALWQQSIYVGWQGPCVGRRGCAAGCLVGQDPTTQSGLDGRGAPLHCCPEGTFSCLLRS